jgi:hypothetical protein
MTAQDALECLQLLDEYGLLSERTVGHYVMNLVGADDATELGRSVYRSVMDGLAVELCRYGAAMWDYRQAGGVDGGGSGDAWCPCPPGERPVRRSDVETLRGELARVGQAGSSMATPLAGEAAPSGPGGRAPARLGRRGYETGRAGGAVGPGDW